MKKKHRKDIIIKYQYHKSPESGAALEEAFDSIFTNMIQGQKRLKEYYKSDEYKGIYKSLCEQKSLLAEFLLDH